MFYRFCVPYNVELSVPLLKAIDDKFSIDQHQCDYDRQQCQKNPLDNASYTRFPVAEMLGFEALKDV